MLSRVKEIVKAFERIRINMIIAFHGFSGTPVEFARKFVGIGAGKTNINTDWQSITWKVLRHWYPELYREFFDEAYTLALKDKGKKAWITGDIEHDFEHAQNRIIYVYARKLFRKPKYWPLLERITRTLQEGNVRMRFLDVSEQEAKEHYLHAELPVTPDPEHGMTAFETIYKLTHERIFEIMGAFNLRNSADAKKVKNVNRARELRLQDWQIYALKRTAAREAAISSGIPDVLEEVFTESKLLSAMADLTKDPKKPKVTLPATLRSMLENIKASGRGNINIRYLNWLLHTDLTLSVPEINALKDSGKTLQEIDNIGIIYRELTRQMKKIIRGPVGVIDTYVSAAQVMDIADAPGELPSEEILREYSPVANAAVASALTAVSDGSARKKPGARAAEIKLAKNKVDTNGKDEFSAVFTETGDTVVIPIAEGLRDLEEEDTFRGGEIIRGSSGKIIAMLVDVVEKTNAAATGGNGAVSMAVGSYGTPELTPTQREALEAKGIEPKRYMINSAALRLAGSMTDSSYSHVLIAQVPGDKTKDFEGAGAINPNDPAEVILKRIADANGDEVSDYEVVLNARDRETKKLEQLKAMAVEYIFERIILEKRRNLVRTLLNAETFNTVKDVKRYVSPLITLRFLAECDQNFAEFKMNETDKNRLTELSATLAQDEDIMALVDEIEKLDKAGESLVINTIADGTFIHGAEAALGLRGRSGKKKILFSTSGSAEAFMNLAVAKAFRKHGAIASNNIMSPALKGQPDLNMRHDFASTQKGIEAAGLIREARDSTPGQEGDGHPNDSAEILSGDKIFTTAHITSENLDAAVAFMTDSDGFNQPGVKRNEDGTYSVVTLRIRYKDGKLYRWLETRRFRVDALGVVLLNPDPQVVSTNIGLKQVPSFRLHSPNAPVTLPERQDILAGISAAA